MTTLLLRIPIEAAAFLKQGLKSLDARRRSSYVRYVQVGDVLQFAADIMRRVAAIRFYPDFETMLEVEDHTLILPGKTKEEVLAYLTKYYQPEDPKEIVVFELEPNTS